MDSRALLISAYAMQPEAENRSVAKGFEKIGIGDARRHLFLCVGPDCCTPEQGASTWELMKRRLPELKLAALRTKAGCFRICCGGPWLVIYPEGIWYGGVTPERCERILTEHLGAGRPIQEWIARVHPLDETPRPPT
jgi:(2Fe-2S) ferredoxin